EPGGHAEGGPGGGARGHRLLRGDGALRRRRRPHHAADARVHPGGGGGARGRPGHAARDARPHQEGLTPREPLTAASQTGYEAAREGAALVNLPDRGVLAVTGPTRQKFLHGVLSNETQGLLPGQGRRAALMDTKGRLLAFMRVLNGQTEVWLEVSGNRIDVVEERLAFYRVAAPVRFQRRPVEVLAVLGPRAGQVLARAGCDVLALEPEGHLAGAVGGQPVLVARAGDLPAQGYVLHAESPAAAAAAAALESAGAVPLARR